MAKNNPRPGRTLLLFFLVVVVLCGSAALGKTWKPQLGLDLEGGTRITLQAEGSPGQTQMNLARGIIESRANGSGVTESTTKIQAGSNIVVEVPGKNASNIVAAVQRTAQLRFRLVAATAAPTTNASPSPSASSSTSPSASPSAKATVKASPKAKAKKTASPKPRPGAFLDETPSPSTKASTEASTKASASTGASPSVTPSPSATASAATGSARVTQALKYQDSPPAADVKKFQAFTCPTGKQALAPVTDDPSASLVTCDADGNKFLLSPAVVEGTELKTSSFGTPPQGTGWAVQLSFKNSATKDFADVSRAISGTGKLFAIVLDGKVISAPQVTEPITDGRPQITGSFTESEARSLSNSLKFGALPVKFKQPTVVTIGPSLAGDQLRAGILAGIIGLAIVMLYCLLYYRGLGLVVLASLVVAGVITYALVLVLAKTASFTLTLPGIAGLIVAVGITADSFIVYFERIRDEMRTGKSMRVAVELGWARARNTCLAADAVSLLAAVVLYIFTIGVVKGFAFALGLSTLIDLAVFFWFTKPMMTWLARFRFFNGGGAMSGLSAETLGIDEGHHGMKPTAAPAVRAAGRNA